MRTKHLIWLACVVAVGGLTMRGGASQAPDVRADYERSNSLNTRIANKVIDLAEAPNWIEGSSRFWYRKSVRGGNQFVLVDAAAASKAPAFDRERDRLSFESEPAGFCRLFCRLWLPLLPSLLASRPDVGARGSGWSS